LWLPRFRRSCTSGVLVALVALIRTRETGQTGHGPMAESKAARVGCAQFERRKKKKTRRKEERKRKSVAKEGSLFSALSQAQWKEKRAARYAERVAAVQWCRERALYRVVG
jgi:hypothetical protein